MMQFLVEAVILTVTGGLLGFLGGAGLAHLLAPIVIKCNWWSGDPYSCPHLDECFLPRIRNISSGWINFWNSSRPTSR